MSALTPLAQVDQQLADFMSNALIVLVAESMPELPDDGRLLRRGQVGCGDALSDGHEVAVRHRRRLWKRLWKR